jgi:hypothetical protein
MNPKGRLAGIAAGTLLMEPKARRQQTRQEQDKIGHLHYSVLTGNTHYKGDMKWRCAILTSLVSLFTKWETRPLSCKKETCS